MTSDSRRKFLKQSSNALFTAIAAQFLLPRFSFAAQSSPGNGRILVLIDLNGGFDGLSLLPYQTGTIADAVRSIRPDLGLAAGDIISFGHQAGSANPIGFNPLLANLINEVGDDCNIIQQIGILDYPGGSHNVCSKIYSAGLTHNVHRAKKGWLANLIDSHLLESYQVFGIGTRNQIDFRAETSAPILLRSLSSYRKGNRGFGAAPGTWPSQDSLYADDIRKRMIAAAQASNQLEGKVKKTLQTLDESLEILAEVKDQAVSAGYTSSGFGRSVEDCAKLAIQLATGSNFSSYHNKSKIFYLRLGGWDSHNNQLNLFEDKLGELVPNLTALIQDLKAHNLWDDTIIYPFSEFGRTNAQNGGGGTDHGWANNHLIMGGSLSPSVAGHEPNINDFTRYDGRFNKLTAQTDFRAPLYQILQWLGFNSPASAFPENFQHTSVLSFK